jgi:hypothetical protein
MTSPEFEMPVALPGMIDGVPIRKLGQKRPWVLGERVESKPIDGKE